MLRWGPFASPPPDSRVRELLINSAIGIFMCAGAHTFLLNATMIRYASLVRWCAAPASVLTRMRSLLQVIFLDQMTGGE